MTKPLFPPEPRSMRRIGWLFVLLGLALTIGMAVITAQMASVVSVPDGGNGTHWTGDHALTLQMFGMFGAVMLFGVIAVLNGLWIVRRGAFHPALRFVTLLLGAAMAVDAVLFILTHGDR